MSNQLRFKAECGLDSCFVDESRKVVRIVQIFVVLCVLLLFMNKFE